MATIGSVLSYEDIVDLRNEGKSDDEIRAYAKAKLAYQKSPEYVAAKRLDDFHKNELKQAFDSGAKGVAIDALRARQNIQKARLIGGASADELQDAANFAGKLQEQAIKQERYKDANALERYYYGGVENVNGMIAGLAKIPMKAAEVLDKRINQYQKNIAQGKETETHAKNLASKVGGFLADSWRSEMFKNLYNNANDIAKDHKARNEAWEQEHPDEWNISRLAGEFVNDPLNLVGGKLIAQGAKQGFKKLGANALEGAAIGGVMSVPHASYHSENLSDFAKGVGLGAGIGAVVQPSLVWAGDKIANRAAKKIANENGLNSNTEPNTEPNSAPNTQNSSTAPNSSSQTAPNTQNSNTDDLATNGVWMEYSANTPQSLRKPNHTSNALRANLEDQQLTLKEQIEKTQESLKNAINKKRLDEAKTLKEKLEKAQKELGEIEKQIGFLDKERDLYPNEMRGSTFNTAEQPINSGDIKGSGFILQGDRKALPSPKLKTADDADNIDLVPDENGVYQVAYNGSSKELAKIATEIAKGDPQSMGAKRLVYIADNLAETAAKDAEQKISANIAKIDNDSVELYANNTALLGDIAKKYPMLSRDEQIELANKQILANASAELIEYSKFLNGGKLPNDARLLGKNLGRMILKSLNAGAYKQEIIDMLLKAGISGRNSTAAKALIQTGDINAYNAVMRQGEAELIAELSQNVRVAAKNESIGAILDSAKAKALENDELLKKGVGNQGLDDVINTFKSSKSGKEFEVAENGFGRELLSYDGVAANEEMKRAFLAWEAQEKKADITLNDGRKVVFLEPDEAVQLSYGNSYLYGEKDFEALFARKQAESLEQKLKRLQSHPAYENLLKMRENTKASELKGDTFGGSKPTVFYEPQSERYLRTQGGGGLPNAERSITITKADVAKLRAGKADKALAIKLENNLEALTGDPAASGVIDDLLTRDYHLASATKKSELVAPKNADEVARTAENSIKGDGFVISGNAVEPKSDLSVKISVDEWVKELAGINPNKQIIADLEHLYKKHKELFSKPSEVFKLIKAVKDNPTFFYTNNQPNIALIGSILENGKLGKIGIQKDFNSDNLQVRHATYSSNAKKENERLLKRNSYPVGSPTPTQLTFGKTAEPTANGAKALLGKEEMLTGTPLPTTTRANNSMGGDLLQHSNVETIPNQSIKEAENQANLAERAAEFSKAYNAIKNIGKYTELLENDYKKIASLNTKDFAQRLKNDIEAYEELADLQEIAYKATNGLLYDDEYVKYFNVKQGQKGYLSKAQSIHDNAFKILDQAPNYISGLYYEISRLKALKSLSKKQDEELKKALKLVNLDAILDLAGLQNYKLMATKIKTALNALTRAKKILDETKSQSGGGLKRGFSTQALNELMLGLGSGGANAVSEDDPNKKAEAFIKGFLAGFGGAKAAKMLAKNAPKLAPQLARASEKMASDFPRLLNDRPDILGGVLGRMNNAKDKFSFIFGGEKALGANKAKLEKARDMAKNGAKDDEIWAKTGWYKDIDGKWKFEINPKGGELNKSAFDNHMAKEKAIEKEISELEKTIDDWENTTAKERVEAREKIDELTQSKNKLSIKLGDFLDDEALYKAYPQFKDTTIKFTSIDGDLGTSFGGKILLNKNMDIAQMKSVLYHELQHEVQYVEDFGVGGTGYFDKAKIKELVEKHPNDTQLKQLYDEIENGWAVDEDNAFNVYQKLAGEAEARNVQARQAMLEKADKEAKRIISMIKDPQKAMRISKDLANVDEYVILKAGNKATGAEHIKLRHTSDPNKTGYVSDDEISRLGENMRKFIIKHGEPYFNKENGNFVYEWVENGNAFGLITNSRSLSKPDIFNPTSKTLRAPATNSRSLQLAPFNRVGTSARDEIITFYSNRNLKTNGAYKFTNPELTWQNATLPNSQLPHPDKTLDIAPNERIVSFDDVEAGMRESFSPELKASYDMRDKLLKSTNEVRASLNEKGKAELEKLAGSKDSKLSRDAQIMRTLENAKSNPVRYAKLKKLYLDENGKVKDSIGLC
nr:LPD23 domain-containing protein [uncultured Campylobacter sp.]